LKLFDQSVPDTVKVNKKIGSMAENLSLSQRLPKLLGIVELRYLHVGAADFLNNVGIAAGCAWKCMFLGKLEGACRVPQQHGTGIEDLY
jgi:hypothetical protein